MKLNEKVLAAEKATYQPPPKEGVMAREELKAKLKGVPVEELQVEAVAMVAAAAKVDLETLHRRLGHAGMERIKELVKKGMAAGVELKEGDGNVEKGKTAVTRDAIFYEDVNYLQWKGVNQEIATGAAAALDKVEKLLVEKENEGIGCDEEETGGGADKPSKEPIFSEPAKKTVVEAVADVEEEGRHERELGETCAEEETQSVEDVENSDGSAKEDGSSPWKLIDSDATCEAAKEMNELLEDGAIVIGKERGLDEIYAATNEVSKDVTPAEELGARSEGALPTEVESVCDHLAEFFQVKQIPRAALFLGMNLERNVEEKKLFLYQKKYCNRVQQRFGQGFIKEITTPLSGMAANDTEQEEDVKQGGGEKKALQMYQSMVGSVMYPVACTKVDMAYAASYLGQHVQQGRKWREMKRALSYLVQHEDEGLLFEGGEETLQLVGYADASHASDKKTGKVRHRRAATAAEIIGTALRRAKHVRASRVERKHVRASRVERKHVHASRCERKHVRASRGERKHMSAGRGERNHVRASRGERKHVRASIGECRQCVRADVDGGRVGAHQLGCLASGGCGARMACGACAASWVADPSISPLPLPIIASPLTHHDPPPCHYQLYTS
ncbi:unnamed protein product [Closterium sp. NIES-64]|nr:unnamed protein product [Closterium sp. NIES-64]